MPLRLWVRRDLPHPSNSNLHHPHQINHSLTSRYWVFRSSKWSMIVRARSICSQLRDFWWPLCSSRVKVGRCGKLMALTDPPFHRFLVHYIFPFFPSLHTRYPRMFRMDCKASESLQIARLADISFPLLSSIFYQGPCTGVFLLRRQRTFRNCA